MTEIMRRVGLPKQATVIFLYMGSGKGCINYRAKLSGSVRLCFRYPLD